MPAVPAANGLAALERDVLVAVAALVVDGARVGVDGGCVLLVRWGVVLLGRHFRWGVWGVRGWVSGWLRRWWWW
jgi:hypothetical protein